MRPQRLFVPAAEKQNDTERTKLFYTFSSFPSREGAHARQCDLLFNLILFQLNQKPSEDISRLEFNVLNAL